MIVKKIMVGGTDSFSYTGTPAGAISVNNGTISADVAPGQYVSTEAAKAGWDLTSRRRATTPNSTGSRREPAGDVQRRRRRDRDLHLHEHEAPGSSIVKKMTQGDTEVFGYTRHAERHDHRGQRDDPADVAPDQRLDRGLKAGWDLTGRCDDMNSRLVANRQAMSTSRPVRRSRAPSRTARRARSR